LHLANPHQDEGTDNAAEPARAQALMRDFAEEPGVVAALGGLRSNVAAAEAPVADRLRFPLLVLAPLTLACPPAPAPHSAPWSFTLAGSAALEALATARSLDARGGRFAVLDDGESARKSVAGCLALTLRAAGAELVLRASLPPGDDAAAARAREAQRQTRVGRVAYVAPAERGTLVCEALAADPLERPDALAQMGHRGYDPASVPKGCRWVVRRLPPRNAAFAAFVQRYRQRFLEAPSDEAAMAYAAAQILTHAIDSAETASPRGLREGVRAALAGSSFETILGSVRFAADGGAMAAWYDTGNSPEPQHVTPSP
jgi:ABC-type branched-subunit amino acid transport system substrate-binding protein